MNGLSTSINLTKEQQAELEKQIRQSKGRKEADRLRVVLYKAQKHSHKFIANLLQMGRNQVTHLLQQFNQGGWSALLQK
jgi:transposase